MGEVRIGQAASLAPDMPKSSTFLACKSIFPTRAGRSSRVDEILFCMSPLILGVLNFFFICRTLRCCLGKILERLLNSFLALLVIVLGHYVLSQRC
jgi:hypothetical protein